MKLVMSDMKPIKGPVYVTKYALTKGIIVCRAGKEDGQYFRDRPGAFGLFITKKDWTYDLEEAKARVQQLVKKKMTALKKQLKALETYEPEMVEWKTHQEDE